MRSVLISFMQIFVLVFVVTCVVTYLWNVFTHGSGAIDWGTAVRLGIILGVVLTWVNTRSQNNDKK